jgi:hypothetical protein
MGTDHVYRVCKNGRDIFDIAPHGAPVREQTHSLARAHALRAKD